MSIHWDYVITDVTPDLTEKIIAKLITLGYLPLNGLSGAKNYTRFAGICAGPPRISGSFTIFGFDSPLSGKVVLPARLFLNPSPLCSAMYM